MNKNKIIQLFALYIFIWLPCIEGEPLLSNSIDGKTSSQNVDHNALAEVALLQKFTGESAPDTKKYALSMYIALQQCLKEKSEKTTISCGSGFKLFNIVKSVIKERNIPMTQEEAALFNHMEEKYSAGPSYQKNAHSSSSQL